MSKSTEIKLVYDSKLGNVSDKNKLKNMILGTIDDFFTNMDCAQECKNRKVKVLSEIESATYEAVMKHVKGNQLRAAKLLNISRGTLRTKLKQYFNTTTVGGRYHPHAKVKWD